MQGDQDPWETLWTQGGKSEKSEGRRNEMECAKTFGLSFYGEWVIQCSHMHFLHYALFLYVIALVLWLICRHIYDPIGFQTESSRRRPSYLSAPRAPTKLPLWYPVTHSSITNCLLSFGLFCLRADWEWEIFAVFSVLFLSCPCS